jgi:membrane fusion protein, heavy metal efflux system
VQIHCHLDDEDAQLIPGTYLRALVETNNNNVTAVPDEAIVNFEGKDYIFIQKDMRKAAAHEHKEEETNKVHEESEEIYIFQMIEITKGNSELGFSEITLPDQFDLKNKIVIKGAYNLLAKMKNSEEGEEHVH